MPLTKLHVPHSLASETCRSIGDALHSSLVDTCGVNPDDNFCLVSRYAPDESIIHPTFLGKRDISSTIVVEITLLSGRSDDQKETFYKDFRERLRAIGFEPQNSIVFLTENTAIDWSFSEAGSVKSVLGL